MSRHEGRLPQASFPRLRPFRWLVGERFVEKVFVCVRQLVSLFALFPVFALFTFSVIVLFTFFILIPVFR